MWSLPTTLEKGIGNMKQKKKTWKTCQTCREKKSADGFNKIKSGYRTNCKKCNAIDKKLVRLYKESGHTTEELMSQFNCSEITINKKLNIYWNASKQREKLKKEKEKQRNRDLVINKKPQQRRIIIINEEKLRYYREEKGLNINQCAKKFNCSNGSIYSRLIQLGIQGGVFASEERICKGCSKKFIAKNSFHVHCSTKCRHLNQSQADHATFLIFKRDGFKCIYCGDSSITDGVKLHCDHIKPKSEGGVDKARNLVTSCKNCNLSKNYTKLKTSTEKQILKEVARRNKLNSIYPNKEIKFPKRLYLIKRRS